jgi:tetratricopeptide (TPR) repeat protein
MAGSHRVIRALLFSYAMVGAVGAGAWAVSTQADSARSAVTSVVAAARAALAQGRPQEAVRLLTTQVQSHPDDLAVRLTLGEAYSATGDATRAEQEFRAALKISQNDVQALVALGSLHDQEGRPEQAEPFLARAVKASGGAAPICLEWAAVLTRLHRYSEAARAMTGVAPPTPVEQRLAYYRLKASIALGMGDARAAAANMEEALSLAPQNRGLVLATGMAEAQAGYWGRAAELLQPLFAATRDLRAGLTLLEAQIGAHQDIRPTLSSLRETQLPPNQELELRLSLAKVLSGHELYEEAAKDFRQAVTLQPGRADLFFDLALAEFRAGQLDAALASAQKARSLQDNASLESLLGDIQEARGDYLAAVHSFQAAVALAPDRGEYRLSLGVELLSHQTFEPARAVFRQGVELFPRSFRLHVALGLTHYFLEEYPEAIRMLLSATRLDANPSLAYDYLGNIQLQQAVTPDPSAVEQLCAYADTHREEAKAQAYCGALLARIGHNRADPSPSPEALRRLGEAARLAPQESTTRCELGKALVWAQQWSQARGELEACVQLDPSSGDGHYLLASAYRHLSQPDLAAKELELHHEATKHMAEANALRDSTLKKFLYTMRAPLSP